MECGPTPVVSHTALHTIARLHNNKSQEAAAVSGIQDKSSRSHSITASTAVAAAEFSPLQKVQTATGAHSAYYLTGTGVLPRE